MDAILGFSTVPLRIATLLGMLTVLASIIAGGSVLVHKLVWGIPLPGYALLACGFFFVGGVQMLLLGIVGEYIGRIYTQVQQRPLYVVQEQSNLRTASALTPAMSPTAQPITSVAYPV